LTPLALRRRALAHLRTISFGPSLWWLRDWCWVLASDGYLGAEYTVRDSANGRPFRIRYQRRQDKAPLRSLEKLTRHAYEVLRSVAAHELAEGFLVDGLPAYDPHQE
jgi:hypothetical protein